LGSAIADMSANADAAAFGALGADVRSLHGASAKVELIGMAVWMMLPLVLPLVDPAVRIIGEAVSRPAAGQGGRWLPASSTRRLQVSYHSPTLRSV